MHLEDKSTSHELGQHSLETAAIIRERDGGFAQAEVLVIDGEIRAPGKQGDTGKCDANARANHGHKRRHLQKPPNGHHFRAWSARRLLNPEEGDPRNNACERHDEKRFLPAVSLTKGLPHNDLGEVDLVAYAALAKCHFQRKTRRF